MHPHNYRATIALRMTTVHSTASVILLSYCGTCVSRFQLGRTQISPSAAVAIMKARHTVICTRNEKAPTATDTCQPTSQHSHKK